MNAQTPPAIAGQVEPPVRPLLLDNETVPTHRCRVCGALWRELGNGTWNLRSDRARLCCDNAPMGAQIEPLTVGQLQPLLAEDLRTRLDLHRSWEADLWWPMLEKPARVGNGTFGVGVSARLVVEAAQRQHVYAEEEGRLTDEQARQHERNRRKLWDMVNGPLCNRMSGGEPCNLRPPCPDCGRACHDVPEGA